MTLSLRSLKNFLVWASELRILIAGGTGFVGQHVVRQFIEVGYKVYLFTRQSPKKRCQVIEQSAIKVVKINSDGSLHSRKITRHCSIEFDAVLNLACCYGRSGELEAEVIESNILLGVTLLQFARETGAKKYINLGSKTSSRKSAYAISKHQMQEWLEYFSAYLQVLDVCVDHIYGPEDSKLKFPVWLLDQFRSSTVPIELTSCEQLRNFIHVKDLSAALLKVVECSKFETGYAAIDVGTTSSKPLKYFVEQAVAAYKKIVGAPPQKIMYGRIKANDRGLQKDLDLRTIQGFGWKPNYELREGVEELVRWYFKL